MTTKPDISAIRERLEKATPGRWYAATGTIGVVGGNGFACRTALDNIAFIADAKQDIPALLSYIDELERTLSKALTLLGALSDEALWSGEHGPETDGVADDCPACIAIEEAGKLITAYSANDEVEPVCAKSSQTDAERVYPSDEISDETLLGLRVIALTRDPDVYLTDARKVVEK